MNRKLTRMGAALVAVAAVASIGAIGGPARAQEDEVTLTVGLIQDLSSPNVTVGYLVADYELWNLQYATLTDKAADDFATIPPAPSRGRAPKTV